MTTLEAPAPVHPLAPLAVLAGGLAVVLTDLHVGGVDVLPDPVGYAVAAGILARTASRHAALRWGCGLALVGLVVSVLTALLLPGAEAPAPLGPVLVLSTVEALVVATLVVLVCTALLDAGLRAPLPGWARALRLALPAALLLRAGATLALLPPAGLVVGGGVGALPALAVGLAVLRAVGVLLTLGFLLLLWRAAREPGPALR